MKMCTRDCDGYCQRHFRHGGRCCYHFHHPYYHEVYWSQMPTVTSVLLSSFSLVSLTDSTATGLNSRIWMTTDRTHVAVAAAARRSWEAHQDVVPPPLAAMHIPHSECRDNEFGLSSIEMGWVRIGLSAYRRQRRRPRGPGPVPVVEFDPSSWREIVFKLNSTPRLGGKMVGTSLAVEGRSESADRVGLATDGRILFFFTYQSGRQASLRRWSQHDDR
jgi:hypothetical protein